MAATSGSRSVGIIVNAVLILAGSAFMFLMAAFAAIGLAMAPAQPGVPRALVAVIVAGVYLLPAALGVVLAIGLLRLRNWARLATVVVAIFFGLAALLGAAMIALAPIPAPPNTTPAFITGIKLVMAACGLAVALFEAYLAWFFLRRKIAAQFAPQGDLAAGAAKSGLPMNRLLIGVFFCFGAACMLPAVLIHAPAACFTAVWTGSGARLFNLLYGFLYLAAGLGLLLRRSWARLYSVALLTLATASAAVFWLAPGWQARSQVMMAAMPTISTSAASPLTAGLVGVLRYPEMLAMLALSAVISYFLIRYPDAAPLAAAVAA